MRQLLLSAVAATALLASAGFANAQSSSTTTTTSTFSPEHGTIIREHSTTQKYNSYSDPNLKLGVGTVVPGTVTIYALPEAVKIPSAETYSYGIINNQPVVVERTTRKVIQTWK
jgi:hypothetical protein